MFEILESYFCLNISIRFFKQSWRKLKTRAGFIILIRLVDIAFSYMRDFILKLNHDGSLSAHVKDLCEINVASEIVWNSVTKNINFFIYIGIWERLIPVELWNGPSEINSRILIVPNFWALWRSVIIFYMKLSWIIWWWQFWCNDGYTPDLISWVET